MPKPKETDGKEGKEDREPRKQISKLEAKLNEANSKKEKSVKKQEKSNSQNTSSEKEKEKADSISSSKKQDKYESLSLEELLKVAKSLSHDQTGCRYLQKQIDLNDYYSNDLFLSLKPDMMDIMNDPFGNYLVQKMIEKLNSENMTHLISVVNANFLLLSKNAQGTRVIQKIIETPNNCEKVKENLHKYALDLLKDNNGYHIILKYCGIAKKAEVIGKTIEENLLCVAMNKFGCCAIQKFLQTFPSNSITKKIISHTEELITNVYGNYVIQFIISMNNQEYNQQIIEKFKNNIIFLSKQKFSSNVIERCFDHCKDSAKNSLINFICEEKVVAELLLDMYGNYGKIFLIRI